jgi:hypothetical protein
MVQTEGVDVNVICDRSTSAHIGAVGTRRVQVTKAKKRHMILGDVIEPTAKGPDES